MASMRFRFLPLHKAVEQIKTGSISGWPGAICPDLVFPQRRVTGCRIRVTQAKARNVRIRSIEPGFEQSAIALIMAAKENMTP